MCICVFVHAHSRARVRASYGNQKTTCSFLPPCKSRGSNSKGMAWQKNLCSRSRLTGSASATHPQTCSPLRLLLRPPFQTLAFPNLRGIVLYVLAAFKIYFISIYVSIYTIYLFIYIACLLSVSFMCESMCAYMHRCMVYIKARKCHWIPWR